MKPRELSVGIATFPYAGNGSESREHPATRRWITPTIEQAITDSRISHIDMGDLRHHSVRDGKIILEPMPTDMDFCDTPIPMTRNAAICEARSRGLDVLVMIDSDQIPDAHLRDATEPTAVPFWKTAFDFVYEQYDKRPKGVCVCAPYCGPPPCENVYVFKWESHQSEHPNVDHRLVQYGRNEAASMRGIHECAAQPTGLIMFDMRLFELADPVGDLFPRFVKDYFGPYEGQVLTPEMLDGFTTWGMLQKYRREQSWFYYEYTDQYQHKKASTEDVTATRDISLIGQMLFDYNPMHCAWDCWAGHAKSKIVGKPRPLTVAMMGEKLRRVARQGLDPEMKCVDLKLG